MAAITIRRGLRKLEFQAQGGSSEAGPYARVEFAWATRLPRGTSVEVPLGLRDGCLRALIGVPRLLGADETSEPRQFRYQVSGPVSEFLSG
jgi:hypothetical protein